MKDELLTWHIHLLNENQPLVQISKIDLVYMYICGEGTWLMSLEGAPFKLPVADDWFIYLYRCL